MHSQKFAGILINVAPRTLAKLKFSNCEIFEPGIELAAHVVAKTPRVSWDYKPCENSKRKSLYALFLLNVDACKSPTNTKFTQTHICHWLTVNIPGNCINKGRTIIDYHMPQHFSQDCETGGFLLLIFKQNTYIDAEKFTFEINEDGCIFVRSTDYITKYNLGKLIAGNYFKVIF